MVAELATQFGVHPTIIHSWKRGFLEGASGVSARGGKKAPKISEDQVRDLLAKIGELAVANGFCPVSSSPGTASEVEGGCGQG